MSDIKNLTLKEAQEKLATRQDDMAKVIAEAKTDSGDLDFRKVKSLGTPEGDSIAVAEKFKAMNSEADALAGHIETLSSAQKAAQDFEAREKGIRKFPFPGGGNGGQGGFGGQPANQNQFKSLGDSVTGAKEFKAWQERNRGGGIDLALDMLPSDFLAKSARFETIGNKALMTTAAGFAPESIRLPGFVEAVTRPIQLLDIIPMGRTSQAAVPYMEETTRTHGAAETAEGGTFAESEFAFTERSVNVAKITDSVPVTDEQLEDVALVESYINGRLSFGVRQRLDRQCLLGNGTAPNLRGILNVSGIQTQTKGDDAVMDAIYKAMVKVRLVGRAMATHSNIHPLDMQDIRLTRTSDGIYIFGSPMEAGPTRLWGLPIVENDALTEGTALVGSFEPSWIMLHERRGIDIQVGYVGSQFGEGKRTIRADMRAALVVMRPAAFCQVTGV
jgi:HK97 family phage major capsid protein